jgi:DNA-binding HxlR family transcriptional regulator
MRSYGQYCPIARAAEIFAERWTPIIVRNIWLGHHTFTGIRKGAPGLSHTLLTQRLRDLERYGIVERRSNGKRTGGLYYLTRSGEDLWKVCDSLGEWGARWLQVTPEHLDPYVVLWSMCNSLEKQNLPRDRTVVRFDFRDRPKYRFWILIEEREAEVCVKPPGDEEDLVVVTDSEPFAKWHMGWLSWPQAVRLGSIRLEGSKALARSFSTWNKRSHFAGVKREPSVVG